MSSITTRKMMNGSRSVWTSMSWYRTLCAQCDPTAADRTKTTGMNILAKCSTKPRRQRGRDASARARDRARYPIEQHGKQDDPPQPAEHECRVDRAGDEEEPPAAEAKLRRRFRGV